MEPNPIETNHRDSKFAATIKNAWKTACDMYLIESGLREDSEEWKYIMKTEHFSQIREVISEMWAKYNNPATGISSDSAQFVTPCVQTTGFKARFNKMIGRKESGKLFLQSVSNGPVLQSLGFDSRLNLEKRLSGRRSKGRGAVNADVNKAYVRKQSPKLKTMIDVVFKFSNDLQSLVIISDLWVPYASLVLGCIWFFFKAAKDFWESYDLITNILLDFNDVEIRIKSMDSIDIELLLSSVYVEMFRLLLKFVGILTRYIRNNEFENYLRRLGSKNDELKNIQDELRQLKHKETLLATIDNLEVSLSIKDNIETMVQTQEDKEIIAWLGLHDTSTNHNMARRKHEETTGNWLFQANAFKTWQNSRKSSLWLNGKPGSGKTILCSTIIEHTIHMCQSTGDKCAYFYFDFNANRTVADMLRSIIAQLCTDRRMPREVRHLYHECRKGQNQPSHANLFNVLSLILTKFHRTFIILDALDECAVGRDRKDLLSTIKQMINASSMFLNILITSRKEKDIEDEFKDIISNAISLEESIVDRDIALHIQKRLEIDADLRDWDNETKKTIKKVLSEKAHGIWVDCQLEGLKDCITREAVKNALSGLPEDLEATYDRILGNIRREENREIAKCVLKLVAVARRPMTVEEISEALAVHCEKECISDDKRIKSPSAILKICPSLIELTDDKKETKVQFTHFSVKEYLLSSRILDSTLSISFFAICETEAHGYAAMVCLIYMLSAFQCAPPRSARFRLLNYAARFWFTHLNATTFKVKKQLERNLVMRLFDTEITNWLKIYDPDIGRGRADNFSSPLYYSALLELTDVTEMLLNKAVDVNAWGGYNRNALQAASARGHEAIVRLLLDKGAHINVQGSAYSNALQAASVRGHEAVVQLLLDRGTDINAHGGDYGNALQAASIGGHESLVRLLLCKGADVNAQGGRYGNALQAASYHGLEAVVRLLLDKGADVNAKGGYYDNALQAASFSGVEAVVKLLLAKGADVNATGGFYGNALQAASRQGDEAVVRLLLDEGADVNSGGGEYGNALQAASFHSHEAVVRLLLDKGADINAQGGNYSNALQAASVQNDKNVVRVLLEKGADVNAQGGFYGNALQAASRHSHEVVVRLLLDKGADVNAQGGDCGNALQAASLRGHIGIVQLLLAKDANVNVQGGRYGNALCAASIEGHETIVRILLDKGADINAQGGFYGNALQAASIRGEDALVRLLLDKGADVNLQGGFYDNALQAASVRGHKSVVRLLIDKAQLK